MKSITPAELHAVLLSQPQTTLLDVRTPVEYEELHIAHARNIPLTALNPRQLFETGKLSQVEPLYLLCRTGARAKLAAQQFASHGFENTVLLEGGTEAWSNAGLPVERGEGSIIGLERQVRIAAGALVLTGVLLAFFVHPWFIGLSAFVGAGLVFAGITDWCGMGLLLARMPWNNRPSTD